MNKKEINIVYKSNTSEKQTKKYNLTQLLALKVEYVEKFKKLQFKLKKATEKDFQHLWNTYLKVSQNYEKVTLTLLEQNQTSGLNKKIKEREDLVRKERILTGLSKKGLFHNFLNKIRRSPVDKTLSAIKSAIIKIDKSLTELNFKSQIELTLLKI